MKFLFGIGIWWWNANAYYAGSLAKVLASNGHEVLVAARKGGLPYKEAEKLGLKTIDIDFDTQNPFKIISALLKLNRVTKSFDPDFVVPATSKAQFLMTLVKIIFNRSLKLIRILADVQSPKANFTNPWFYNRWLNWIVSSADACKKRVHETINFPLDKISTIYLGYDSDKFFKEFNYAEMKAKYAIPVHVPVVLNIGRLAKEKDQITLIRALPIIAQHIGEFRIIISGEEQYYTLVQLREMAQKTNIDDKLILLERSSDVRELLSIGDIGVITSMESEVVCRIATEYMIYGLPIIGTDVNVIPEMVKDDINGIIVSKKNPEMLAAAIIKLLSNKEQRNGIGKNNFNKARSDYSIQLFYEKFLTVCKSLN